MVVSFDRSAPDAPRQLKFVVENIFRMLNEKMIGAGLSASARKANLLSLWSTHLAEWLAYEKFNADPIVDAITNDATHGWLDTVLGGQTVRLHIVDRLNAGLGL